MAGEQRGERAVDQLRAFEEGCASSSRMRRSVSLVPMAEMLKLCSGGSKSGRRAHLVALARRVEKA